jgi:hypothetical protein
MAANLEIKLDRLTRLVGTDEGFYILALHAFVEYFLRYEKRYGEGPSFPELTWIFREELLQNRGEGFVDGLYCLTYDDAQTERLLRNLLYVGITRAMDNLNAFLLEGGDPILRDLAGCFGV